MHGSMITSLNPEIATDLFLYGQDMEALYDYAKEIYPPGKVHYFIKNDEKDQFEQLRTSSPSGSGTASPATNCAARNPTKSSGSGVTRPSGYPAANPTSTCTPGCVPHSRNS